MSATQGSAEVGDLQRESLPVINPPQLDEPQRIESVPEEHPTVSHELANADYDEKGAAQEDLGQTEVRDLGWNEHPADVPTPLVGGLANEELWTLMRRFNKVRYSLNRCDYTDE